MKTIISYLLVLAFTLSLNSCKKDKLNNCDESLVGEWKGEKTWDYLISVTSDSITTISTIETLIVIDDGTGIYNNTIKYELVRLSFGDTIIQLDTIMKDTFSNLSYQKADSFTYDDDLVWYAGTLESNNEGLSTIEVASIDGSCNLQSDSIVIFGDFIPSFFGEGTLFEMK